MTQHKRTETSEQSRTPNPGSSEAVEQGCTCPIIDNHHGKGIPAGKDGTPMFWYSAKCPLHGRGVGMSATGEQQ